MVCRQGHRRAGHRRLWPHRSQPCLAPIRQDPGDAKTAWRYFDLLGTIQNELNIPCGYDTDVNVACLGEVTFGCAKGLTDVVYLTIGTGVGAGVLSGVSSCTA